VAQESCYSTDPQAMTLTSKHAHVLIIKAPRQLGGQNPAGIPAHHLQLIYKVDGRETEEQARQLEQDQVQLHTNATKQGDATQSEAKPKTPNPHTGSEAGLKQLSQGPGKAAHWGPASGSARDENRPREVRPAGPGTPPGLPGSCRKPGGCAQRP
jgi:hypothetical protein